MASGVFGYPTEAGLLGGQKRRGETPMGVGGTSSTVIFLSVHWAQEQLERCSSCNRHSTCSALGPSDRACKCFNAARHFTG